ncbi:MAG: tetratricopeptide repeat protein [Henriciella sp.]
MKIKITLCAALILAAACESVPTEMDAGQFALQIDAVSTNPSVFASDRDLTTLLARDDLTPDQRADAVFLRAKKRFEGRYNMPGAIKDYDQFIALAPADPRIATAERHIVFAATEIENAQRRLAQLQNLPDWFDDKVLMGEFDTAVARYRKAGLTPTESQVYLLREAGYVCSGEGDAVHLFGPVPEHAADAIWCPDPSVS